VKNYGGGETKFSALEIIEGISQRRPSDCMPAEPKHGKSAVCS